MTRVVVKGLDAVALVLIVGVWQANAAVPADLVTSLPGWEGPLTSKMYSGIMSAGESCTDEGCFKMQVCLFLLAILSPWNPLNPHHYRTPGALCVHRKRAEPCNRSCGALDQWRPRSCLSIWPLCRAWALPDLRREFRDRILQ